jgi:hypothetical protein
MRKYRALKLAGGLRRFSVELLYLDMLGYANKREGFFLLHYGWAD